MKWLMKIFLALLFVMPVQAWAASDERGGFRDLYWGESLESVQKTRDVEDIDANSDTNISHYWVNLTKDEPHVLAGIPIRGDRFIVTFWKNQLLAVVIPFSDENSNFWSMKNALTHLHGQPYHDESIPWVTSTIEGMSRSGDMNYDGGAYFWIDKTTCYALLHYVEQDKMFFVMLVPIAQMEKMSNEQDALGW